MDNRQVVDPEGVEASGLTRPTIGMALVRLVLFAVPLFVLLELSGSLLAPLAQRQVSPARLAMLLLVCAIAIAAYRVAVRLIERRDPLELYLDTSLWFALAGILFGTALFFLVYGVLWLAGIASFAGVRGFDGVPPVLAISLGAAIGEEIFFRGVLYRIVENTFGTAAALVVSSALFGLAHAANPEATSFSTTAIALEAGLLLGLAYTVTRSLWFPIGIHFAWNFTQSGIFGAPLSGFRLDGILNVPLTGPEILTGGAFGPEASVVTLIVCLLISAMIGWAAVRRGQWRALKASSMKAQP
jgi:membrane protease YdiL (CAAX protease family)